MSTYGEQRAAKEAEAAKRIRLERTELPKYSGYRSAYKVLIDGDYRGDLFCKAGWGRGWSFESLDRQYRHLRPFIHNKATAPYYILEAYERSPEKYPTDYEILGREKEAQARVEAAAKKVAEEKAQREAELATAIEGLREIGDNHRLTNFQSAALDTALKILRTSR